MEGVLNEIFSMYEIFLLVFVRTSGIFIFSPLFSSQNVLNIAKIGFTFALSILITLSFPGGIDLSGEILFILIFKELLIGVILGFISYIFFSSFYTMGQLIDMKIGFGMANVVDPQSKAQVPLSGNFYYIIALLLLLLMDGHHLIITALKDSYLAIPLGSFTYDIDTLKVIISGMVQSFEIAFKLSTPIIAIIFLTDLVLGVLARTIPQMNVFVVGMPLKLLIGLLFISVGFPLFFSGVDSIMDMIVTHTYEFLKYR